MDVMVAVFALGLICPICYNGQLWVLQKLGILEISEKLQQTLKSKLVAPRESFVYMTDIPIRLFLGILRDDCFFLITTAFGKLSG